MTWWERGRQMKAIYSELEYSLDRHRPASVVANRSKEEVVSSPVQSIKSGYWVIYWNFKKKSSFVSTSRDADHTYIGSGYLFPSKHFFKLSIPSVVSIKKNNPTSYFFSQKNCQSSSPAGRNSSRVLVKSWGKWRARGRKKFDVCHRNVRRPIVTVSPVFHWTILFRRNKKWKIVFNSSPFSWEIVINLLL